MEILPFRGFRYNLTRVQDLSAVVSPPYDVISPPGREKYYHRHRYNFVHLTLGKELPGDNEISSKYQSSAKLLHRWIREKIVIEDTVPSIYLYSLQFNYRRKLLTRQGIISLVRLEEYFEGKIFPHEVTLEETKTDRLALLKACKAHLEPVFGVWFSSGEGEDFFLRLFEAREELVEVMDDEKVIHSLGRVSGKEHIESLKSFLRDKFLIIADGHHRYEAALEYQHQQSLPDKDFAPWRYVMMYLVSREDPGLVVLPTHRLISFSPLDFSSLMGRLKSDFQIHYFKFQEQGELYQRESLFSHMAFHRPSLGMYFGKEKIYCMLLPRRSFYWEEKSWEWNSLEAVILQKLVLEPIFGIKDVELEESKGKMAYTRDEEEAVQKVREGSYQVAFFLNPLGMDEIEKISFQGERMPSKSTYFYPKPLSGLVFYAWKENGNLNLK